MGKTKKITTKFLRFSNNKSKYRENFYLDLYKYY